MKAVLIGADGQLGSDIGKFIEKKNVVGLTISDIDITDEVKLNKVLSSHSPEVVINTAAFHRVDDCEKENLKAFSVNSVAVRYLAVACKKLGAKLVHISTDYVFDGEKGSPYIEDDMPNPKSAYGISKLAGELYIKYLLPEHFIIRTSSLFGIAGCLGKGGGNFIETMMKAGREKGEAKVVADQVVSPTYTYDLARKISELIKTTHYGTYHITNRGECSWYEFAKKIFELARMKVDIKPVTTDFYNAPAHRPKYSVLRHKHLEALGLDDMRTWQDALKDYLLKRGYLKG